MNIFRILRVSFRALGRNKMRTFLTMLGIIIGVGAVIAMVSIGAGAKQAVEDRFSSMGTNLLFVSPGSKNAQGVRTGFGGFQTLKADDAKAIKDECPSVMDVSPSVSSRSRRRAGRSRRCSPGEGSGCWSRRPRSRRCRPCSGPGSHRPSRA